MLKDRGGRRLTCPIGKPVAGKAAALPLAQVWIANKQFAAASNLLANMANADEAGGRAGRLIAIDVIRALALKGLGGNEEALQILEKCLPIAQARGYCRVFLDQGKEMEELIRFGQQQNAWQVNDLEGYVDSLLSAFK